MYDLKNFEKDFDKYIDKNGYVKLYVKEYMNTFDNYSDFKLTEDTILVTKKDNYQFVESRMKESLLDYLNTFFMVTIFTLCDDYDTYLINTHVLKNIDNSYYNSFETVVDLIFIDNSYEDWIWVPATSQVTWYC